MSDIYITVYTKEHGKIELTEEEWCFFDMAFVAFHRVDGPALEWADGYRMWFLEGESYNEEEYWEEIARRNNRSNILKMVE